MRAPRAAADALVEMFSALARRQHGHRERGLPRLNRMSATEPIVAPSGRAKSKSAWSSRSH
ncbi:hypothetical protein ACFRQM_11120 [Streptomyces sp. NPDC056831]|uniref:hypothetical protein n=1 Tax=Streptomyces sp. NPDC056831 TaxID=3345954 RepID=UPI0036CB0056